LSKTPISDTPSTVPAAAVGSGPSVSSNPNNNEPKWPIDTTPPTILNIGDWILTATTEIIYNALNDDDKVYRLQSIQHKTIETKRYHVGELVKYQYFRRQVDAVILFVSFVPFAKRKSPIVYIGLVPNGHGHGPGTNNLRRKSITNDIKCQRVTLNSLTIPSTGVMASLQLYELMQSAMNDAKATVIQTIQQMMSPKKEVKRKQAKSKELKKLSNPDKENEVVILNTKRKSIQPKKKEEAKVKTPKKHDSGGDTIVEEDDSPSKKAKLRHSNDTTNIVAIVKDTLTSLGLIKLPSSPSTSLISSISSSSTSSSLLSSSSSLTSSPSSSLSSSSSLLSSLLPSLLQQSSSPQSSTPIDPLQAYHDMASILLLRRCMFR